MEYAKRVAEAEAQHEARFRVRVRVRVVFCAIKYPNSPDTTDDADPLEVAKVEAHSDLPAADLDRLKQATPRVIVIVRVRVVVTVIVIVRVRVRVRVRVWVRARVRIRVRVRARVQPLTLIG